MTQEDKINKAIEELFKREQFYQEKRMAYAEAEYDYRVGYATEYGKASGTIESKKNTAMEKVAKKLEAREVAEAESDIAYQLLQDCRQVLSARQSLLKTSLERGV